MLDLAHALESLYDEVNSYDFYRDIFPVGSFEEKGVYEDGKYNGIAVSISMGDKRTKRFTVTDDLDVISELASTDDFCLISPISYAGKSRKSENARFLYAMAIDLDGIDTLEHWDYFLWQINFHKEPFGLPLPTYVVSSGTGVHLYYVFVKPIPCFKNIVQQLELLKRRLTTNAWGQGASSLVDNIQYESLFQGFRMVGTITKTGGRCRAFKVGEKVTIDYLNSVVPEEFRVKSFAYKTELPIAKAKELYPDWYQERVVNGRPKKSWTCKKDLYDWWLRRSNEPLQGHRYWYVMTLATYAKKCAVPYKTLEKDALGLVDLLNSKGDTFTEDDVMHALEAYNDSYITYPIDTIVQRTAMPIPKNKRNGRTQDVHIKTVNAMRKFRRDELGEDEYKNNGRPKGSGTAAQTVYDWRQSHQDGKKIECERETGLSRHTVLKWWTWTPPKRVVAHIPHYLNMTEDEIRAEMEREFEKWERQLSNSPKK